MNYDALFQGWREIGGCFLVALTVERSVLQILQPCDCSDGIRPLYIDYCCLEYNIM